MKETIFISGDEKGSEIICCNCGTRFIDSLLHKTVKQQKLDRQCGSVVCTCGGRIAYIELTNNPYVE